MNLTCWKTRRHIFAWRDLLIIFLLFTPRSTDGLSFKDKKICLLLEVLRACPSLKIKICLLLEELRACPSLKIKNLFTLEVLRACPSMKIKNDLFTPRNAEGLSFIENKERFFFCLHLEVLRACPSLKIKKDFFSVYI